MTRVAFAIVLAALASGAQANVLYKSIDERGTVTFSDVPPPAGTAILEQRPLGVPAYAAQPGYAAESYGTGPTPGLEQAFQMIDYDKALREANERVDLAEHALAQARAGRSTTPRPGLNPVGGLAQADAERIEFHKKDLRAAQVALAELLRSRQLASGRTPR